MCYGRQQGEIKIKITDELRLLIDWLSSGESSLDYPGGQTQL